MQKEARQRGVTCCPLKDKKKYDATIGLKQGMACPIYWLKFA